MDCNKTIKHIIKRIYKRATTTQPCQLCCSDASLQSLVGRLEHPLSPTHLCPGLCKYYCTNQLTLQTAREFTVTHCLLSHKFHCINVLAISWLRTSDTTLITVYNRSSEYCMTMEEPCSCQNINYIYLINPLKIL